MLRSSAHLLVVLALLIQPASSGAEPQPAPQVLRLAVAANFTVAVGPIARQYEKSSGQRVEVVSGSTGKLAAQIRSGAPFDVFLAADTEAPHQLAKDGLVEKPFTYAIGTLVLWSKKPGYVDAQGDVLKSGSFRHLALANPQLAPYGRAAQQLLEHRKLWATLEPSIVLGENVAQAFQFVETESAELGFVALSQLLDPEHPAGGSRWLVPAGEYEAIQQGTAVVARTPQPKAARAFARLLAAPGTCRSLESFGYRCPQPAP
ncbi:MAG TPA: molybdate ABC transporter substrate-binding protein [Polyangiaceae bacterium]|nr:molybdate ABC transporter substrate-binding protein [Polyangiaceae bacterium]